MLNNLLAQADKFRTVEIGEAALYALLGFAIVFLGIAFLILIVWLVGKIMQKSTEKPAKEKVEAKPTEAPTTPIEEECSEEMVAVITAALMAYYEQTNPKCSFTVKRIKRI